MNVILPTLPYSDLSGTEAFNHAKLYKAMLYFISHQHQCEQDVCPSVRAFISLIIAGLLASHMHRQFHTELWTRMNHPVPFTKQITHIYLLYIS